MYIGKELGKVGTDFADTLRSSHILRVNAIDLLLNVKVHAEVVYSYQELDVYLHDCVCWKGAAWLLCVV